MLDKRRIRLMTKLALYEQSDAWKDLKISGYYKEDYVGLKTLKGHADERHVDAEAHRAGLCRGGRVSGRAHRLLYMCQFLLQDGACECQTADKDVL